MDASDDDAAPASEPADHGEAADESADDTGPAEEPRAVDRWRRETATGAVTAALALGLRHVFEPERADTVAIEQEAPSKPTPRDRVEIRFDPLSSQGTVVVVRRPPDPSE